MRPFALGSASEAALRTDYSGFKQVQPFWTDGGGEDAPRHLRPPRAACLPAFQPPSTESPSTGRIGNALEIIPNSI